MNITLGEGVKMDLDKLIESRLLIQANSGGGKSWAIRRLIEQAFGKKQIIVIDPEGEFGNLRERYDFVYAGKGGDAPVESRSAALLAHRLLELKASAIIDLYELPPQERKHFVRLFCEAMVNGPKELWHDVLVIIDEAHIFAPEKGESEAMGAVIDLATRGRKRGYCAVLATQRLPKLNKDAAAECNNKLIGRASQDIDRKRAAEELGFSSKEDVLSLRHLDPGEFYAFGPAVSRDVVRFRIGDIHVKPAKRGVSRGTVPAPSAKVKAILSKLADLPQEALQEARTTAELKTALASARGEITRLSKQAQPELDPKQVSRIQEEWYQKGVSAVESSWRQENERVHKEAQAQLKKYEGVFNKIADIIRPVITDGIVLDVKKHVVIPKLPVSAAPFRSPRERAREVIQVIPIKRVHPGQLVTENDVISKGELAILAALAPYGDGVTREHLTILTTYKRSTRDRYIQYLQQKGMVQVEGNGRILITPAGIESLGSDYKPLPTGQALIEHYLKTLPAGEVKILQALLDSPDRELSREALTEATGYQRSTRDRYIQYMQVRMLVDSADGMIKISIGIP